MTLEQLRAMPESIPWSKIDRDRGFDHPKGYHESLLKSYQVLQKVEKWLELGTHPSVVLEMIQDAYAHITPEEGRDG